MFVYLTRNTLKTHVNISEYKGNPWQRRTGQILAVPPYLISWRGHGPSPSVFQPSFHSLFLTHSLYLPPHPSHSHPPIRPLSALIMDSLPIRHETLSSITLLSSICNSSPPSVS